MTILANIGGLIVEIIKIEEAKKQIGKNVKFFMIDNIPENLQSLDSFEGIVKTIRSQWEHSDKGDNCISFSCQIDVVDPKDGGIHHLSSDRIFAIDTKDEDVKNVEINDKITELQKRIDELKASKMEI